MFRIESTLAECLYSVHVNHFFEVVEIPDFDFLQLVRGAETVEEVEEGNTALDCCEVSNGAEVHNFLSICFCEHSEAGLAASVYVRVVAEDVERVAGNTTS